MENVGNTFKKLLHRGDTWDRTCSKIMILTIENCFLREHKVELKHGETNIAEANGCDIKYINLQQVTMGPKVKLYWMSDSNIYI